MVDAKKCQHRQAECYACTHTHTHLFFVLFRGTFASTLTARWRKFWRCARCLRPRWVHMFVFAGDNRVAPHVRECHNPCCSVDNHHTPPPPHPPRACRCSWCSSRGASLRRCGCSSGGVCRTATSAPAPSASTTTASSSSTLSTRPRLAASSTPGWLRLWWE